eukprot:365986-Chlamydomonas_euryale.AAC.13
MESVGCSVAAPPSVCALGLNMALELPSLSPSWTVCGLNADAHFRSHLWWQNACTHTCNFVHKCGGKMRARTSVRTGHFGVDIGPQSCVDVVEEIKACKTLFWNGPMGKYEVPDFSNGTTAVAKVRLRTLRHAFRCFGNAVSLSSTYSVRPQFNPLSCLLP